MRNFIAPTEDFIKLERTKIATDVTAGSNVTIVLDNNDHFADDDFIVVGREGSEKAEICQINDAVVAGQNVRVATLLFNHKAGEDITKYRYDKRKFYGCATVDGSYVELTSDGSPALIQVDDPQGTTFEYAGDTYSYFKATYYNSSDLTETDIADSTAVQSDQTSRYTTIYAIRVQAGLTQNPYINDGRIEEKRKQAENEINSILFRLYTLPLTEVPELIQRVCTLLAAGYIDFEEYGPDGQGVKWLGEARGILHSIRDGKQNLIGTDGTELARKTGTQGINSFPDSVDDNNGPRQYFKMGQRF